MEPQHFASLYPATTREEEISRIFSFIKEGKSMQLLAFPGVGRANVLEFLTYNRNIRIHHVGEEKQILYHFVLTNFSEIKNRSPLDVLKFLFLELTSSLHERRRDEEFLVVDKLFKDSLSYNDELVLFQGLKDALDFLSLEKKLTIIFLFDRFETYIPFVTEEFFTNLRSLRSRAKYQFSIVFSITRPLEDILEPQTLADFYEFVAENHVYLQLKDDVGLSFREAYLEKLTKQKLLPKVVHELVRQTAGHGKLTRLGLEAIFAQGQQGISESFLLGLKTIQGALIEIWSFLTPDEQQDMLTLCHGEKCPLPSVFLKNVGLITNEKIAIPLFQTFVQTKKQISNDRFVFDDQTNTIKRGNIVISDMLTKAEFRLFKFLLEKDDELVSREDVIQIVWSDLQNQAGVSEQAVDQLIFRLRKKIEDDPTNPTHIQTIKGRGVKFTQ